MSGAKIQCGEWSASHEPVGLLYWLSSALTGLPYQGGHLVPTTQEHPGGGGIGCSDGHPSSTGALVHIRCHSPYTFFRLLFQHPPNNLANSVLLPSLF